MQYLNNNLFGNLFKFINAWETYTHNVIYWNYMCYNCSVKGPGGFQENSSKQAMKTKTMEHTT